jgi:Holliday junction resolvase RusA-like endonuclease
MAVAPIYFVVHGQPCSVNRAYRRARNGRLFMSPEGVSWKLRVSTAAANAMRGKPPLEGPLVVRMAFFFQSRRSDIDGPLKLSMDSLQPAVMKNDLQVVEVHLAKGLDKELPRVEIQVECAP